MLGFHESCSLALHSLILEGGKKVFEDPPHNIKEGGAGVSTNRFANVCWSEVPRLLTSTVGQIMFACPKYIMHSIPQSTKACDVAEGTPFSGPHAVVVNDIEQSVLSFRGR